MTDYSYSAVAEMFCINLFLYLFAIYSYSESKNMANMDKEPS